MKDYKKILEGLVNIINNTEKSDIGFATICTFIGENCPELKENEDEMWIYCYYKSFGSAVRNLATKGTKDRKPIKIWM